MDAGFTAVIEQLVARRGKEVLLDNAKAKALLSDYTRGEYKRESKLFREALEAGVAGAINGAAEAELPCVKLLLSKRLQGDDYLAPDAADEIVRLFAKVLRGDDSPVQKEEPLLKARIKRVKRILLTGLSLFFCAVFSYYYWTVFVEAHYILAGIVFAAFCIFSLISIFDDGDDWVILEAVLIYMALALALLYGVGWIIGCVESWWNNINIGGLVP
jgi:hypothetical protein